MYIWANSPAVEIVSSILRPRPFVNYVNGNTALGGFDGARQRVHAEAREYEFGILDELLEERGAVTPPIQPVVKKGSVVLRDLRLWLAGLANPSPDARIMLAFVHTPWVRFAMPLSEIG